MQYSKKELRKLAKERLSTISDNERHRKSESLSRNLKKFLAENFTTHEKIILGGFSPLIDEPDWSINIDLVEYNMAFPGIGSDGKMSFFKSNEVDLKETDEFGARVKTPTKKGEVMTPDLILIPGLAFTKNGHRLGRGKGFFDKYLENYNGKTIGICFEEQIFESIPTEKHDQMIDFVVTDGKIYRR